MQLEYTVIGFFASCWFLQWYESLQAEPVKQKKATEIQQLRTKIKELEKLPVTSDKTIATEIYGVYDKQARRLVKQWEQVAQWAQAEGIDINQPWNLANLQNKLRTERSNQDAQITELQNKEKELVVELTQKFNERLAQERQKITALSNKVSQLGGIDIWEIWKKCCPSDFREREPKTIENWEQSLRDCQNDIEKLEWLARLFWPTYNQISYENFVSGLSCEGLKTHAEQSQLKLDYLRKNLDNLVPLPKPQREDFSNDNEYQQALVAWQKENQKT